MKQIFISFLLFCNLICYAQNYDSISVSIIQPNVYMVKNEWYQQINFDFNIENKMSETINLKRIELNVYDINKNLVNVKVLRDGPVTPSIATVPNRQIGKNENTTIYNPFTVFNPHMDLHHLQYKLYFKSESGNTFTLGIDVKPELYIPKTDLSIPLKGTLFILDGSDLYSNHRRFDINNPLVYNLLGIHTNPEMFAVDFSVIDNQGEAYSNDWNNNMNYYIFGKTVYAPASGKIIKIINDCDDNIPGNVNFKIEDVKTNKDLLPGNYVAIDHLNGEYSFLVHLKKGSIPVKEGETVKKGQPIGEVGNSGSSMYPHLHYQLVDKPDYTNSNALPIYFHNYSLMSGNKKIKIKRGFINTGDIIENKK